MNQDYLWWRDGVVYQIYPRSFMDSNGDGVGDLKGIASKLDYLAGLGVAAIWLSPIYPSPDVDFGYDVSDYTAIDPRYGSMEDFDHLVKEAHQRGIRVILDLVLNHTSDQHPWFLESKKSRENPYRDWYLWRDPQPNGKPPNNWQSIFGGPGWQYDPVTGQSYFHMFCKEQPDVNWRNPDTRKAMLKVFRFWLERGVDGFRLDVFNAYFKTADLKDNPTHLFGLRAFERQRHVNDIDQPEMLPLLKDIRQMLDEYPERYAVGETFLATPRMAAHYCGVDQLHAAFNFSFLHSRWNARQFLNNIQDWENILGDRATPNYVLNNHDVTRSATRYGIGENDERLKVAAGMLLTLRGTPFIYYGEEIGMRDVQLARSQIMDPVGKRYWPIIKGRDGCRGPMQWDASQYAGFSTAKPWLPIHTDHTQRNVVGQDGEASSLLNFYRKLIHLRREVSALHAGMFTSITFDPHYVLGYLRQTADQTVLVALNFGLRPHGLVLGQELARAKWKLLLSNKRDELQPMRDRVLPLDREEVCILIQE